MSDRVVFITDEDLGLKPETCPCCGQRVSVQTADEGTSSYVGEEYNAAIEDAVNEAKRWIGLDGYIDKLRALKKGGEAGT